MHQVSVTDPEGFKVFITAKREATIVLYNDALKQLDKLVSKGIHPALLNRTAALGVSEIEDQINRISDLKKQIFSINSVLLSLDFGNYGVCVKSGKYIPREFHLPLCNAGFEAVVESSKKTIIQSSKT